MSFFSKAFERRFQVNADVTDPRAWMPFFMGGPTKSGKHVTHESALSFVWFWAAIQVKAKTVSSLPLDTFRRLPDDKREKARNHNLFNLLRTRPNPWMSAARWKWVKQMHLDTWGNAYDFVERAVGGRIKNLWPIRPDWIQPRAEDGVLSYVYRKGTKHEEVLDFDEVLHIPGPGFDGIKGYSIIRLFRETIGYGQAVEEFGARFFGSGTHPGIIVSHEGKLSPEGHKNLREQLTEKYSNLGNTHRLMLLDEGMKLENVGIPPDDAQFLETMKFTRTAMAAITGVPPHMMGDLERATFTNIENQSLEFVKFTIGPWLNLWEEEIALKLLPEQSNRFFVEFNIDALLRGDFESRMRGFAIGRQWGFLTVNDILKKLNMNPIGAEGDIRLSPQNMVDAKALLNAPQGGEDDRSTPAYWEGKIAELFEGGEPDGEELQRLAAKRLEAQEKQSKAASEKLLTEGFPPSPQQQPDLRALVPVFEDAARRVLSRERNELSRRIPKAERDGQLDQMLDEFYEKDGFMAQAFREAFEPACQTAAGLLGSDVEGHADRRTQDYVSRRCQEVKASGEPPADAPAEMAEREMRALSLAVS